MRIFVTGASGFLGGYLIRNLLNYDYKILVLNRSLKDNYQFESKINFVNKGLEELNLKDIEDVETIIHFASAGVSPKKVSLLELEKTNVEGSYRLIKLAHKAGVRRFIVAGSCLEYGEEANNWEYIPSNASLQPICNYSNSKVKAFIKLKEFALKNNIELFYGRIFSAYGNGQFEENFWPSLKRAALSGKNFQMTSGNQIRDFIKVEKVANHFVDAILRKDVISFRPYIVNIGTGHGTSLKDFAIREWHKFNASGQLIIGGLKSRPNEIQRMVANIDGLKLINKI